MTTLANIHPILMLGRDLLSHAANPPVDHLEPVELKSPSDLIPPSPSCIHLLDLASPALKTANGYKSIGSINAEVSPTVPVGGSVDQMDPVKMYLEQAKKLERQLQA